MLRTAFVLGALLATPVLAQQVSVDIDVDASSDSMRLVLTHSRQLVYAIRALDGRIEVVYGEPIRIEPARQRFEDPVLERYQVEEGNRLVLHTGEGYRGYGSFELQNPFRLVLDLRGARARADTTPGEPARRDPDGIIVVLDPGHGGIENGAVGPTGLREKDVTLHLAQGLRRALAQDRAISVVLTRDEDRLISLDERTAVANHNRADLFVSIHLNASPRTTATGAETYFLSADATDDEARTLAALENRAAGVAEESLFSTEDGERRDLDLVLWDLAQNRFLAESSVLAESMQRQLNELTGTRDRGVRQAPFRVLMGATMPAILVEAGFISNPAEEDRFRSFEYRNRVIDAMARAIRDYVRDIEALSGPPKAGPSATGGP